MADDHEYSNPIFCATIQKKLSYLPATEDQPIRLLLGGKSRPITPGYVPLLTVLPYRIFSGVSDSAFETRNVYKRSVRIYSKESNNLGQENEDVTSITQTSNTLWRYELSYQNLPGYPDTSGLNWEDSQKKNIAQALELDADGRAWLRYALSDIPVTSPAELVTRDAQFNTIDLASQTNKDGVTEIRLETTDVEVSVSASPGAVRVAVLFEPAGYGQRLLVFPGAAAGAKVCTWVNLRQEASLVRVVGGEWLTSDVTFSPVLEIWTLPGKFDNNWYGGVSPVLHQSIALAPLTLTEIDGSSIIRAAVDSYVDVLAEFTVPESRIVIPVIRVLDGSPVDYFNANCPMITDEDGYPEPASFDLHAAFTLTFRESAIGTK